MMKKGYWAFFLILGLGTFFLFYDKVKTKGHAPTVSVVMPTYNRAALLPRTIDSILTQSFTDFEFIIVDDGSTDESMGILKSYAQKDSRIVLLKNTQNRGISHARNKGNRRARGKYIAILDSDDPALPGRLEKQVAFLEEHPDTDVVQGRIRVEYTKKDPMPVFDYTRPTLPYILFDNVVGHSENMVRRDFLIQNGIMYDETLRAGIDYDFWKQVLLNGGRFAKIQDVINIYRLHHTNQGEYYAQQAETRQKVSREMLVYFGVPADLIEGGSRCAVFSYVLTKSPRRWVFDERALRVATDDECRREAALEVKE
ncbi:MAG: glycosyltransferase [Lactobacillales bacterium]|jgi:glycosyltransferase involved in cell wall biosynthesis|nr:glycosyltransferase [Lactobacillales bacterium]